MNRRRLIAWLGGLLMPLCLRRAATAQPATGPSAASRRATREVQFPSVVPGYRLRFPDDHGSHPEFRLEWWYATGWLDVGGPAQWGFQVTFFRTRPGLAAVETNPSAFAPRQILIAHGAISDPQRTRLLHDERIARAAFGLAGADTGHTRVWIDDWSLVQHASTYHARVPGREFLLDLTLTATQPPLAQGDGGYSRKGPDPELASYYYSVPQLAVVGMVVAQGRRLPVTGRAWLDHEWSSALMDERAAGWDWIGINLDDGGALMAFRMRDRAGGKFWAGGGFRAADGARRIFSPREVEFEPLRLWRSPRSGASYPVAWRVRTGELELTIEPLMDDQESDTRASVGTIYWEGAVHAMRGGRAVGRGYLELTGYWRPMRL
jgi:predicted secreted hydrolase